MEYSKPIWISKWEYEIVPVDFLWKKILLKGKLLVLVQWSDGVTDRKQKNAEREKGAI